MAENSCGNFSLARIISYLEYVEDATSKTKLALKSNCHDMRQLLKPWSFPCDIRENLVCTCPDPEEEKVKEFENKEVENIEKVLKKAHHVRTKSQGAGCDRSRGRTRTVEAKGDAKCDRGSSVQSANASATRVAKLPLSKTECNVKAKPRKSAELKSSSVPSAAARHDQAKPRRGTDTKKSSSAQSTAIASNKTKQIQPIQSTYQKDFTSRRRSSSRPRSKSTSEDTTGSKTSNMPAGKSMQQSARIGTKDLDTILSQVSAYCHTSHNSQMATSTSTAPQSSCLVHGNVGQMLPSHTIQLFTIEEAIAIRDVPMDLLKAINVHHKYLETLNAPHQTKEAKHFLRLVYEQNKRFTKDTHDPIVKFLMEYLEVYQEAKSAGILKTKVDGSLWKKQDVGTVHCKIEDVETRFRNWISFNTSVSSSAKSHVQDAVMDSQGKNNPGKLLPMMGIWNSSERVLKGLPKDAIIPYHKPSKLEECQKLLQDLQEADLKCHLLSEVVKYLLPWIQSMDPSFHLFPLVYRTICVLSDLGHPILMKEDVQPTEH